MNEQLVKFIELCLADGILTDKEREVIFRKSKEFGVPEDECEIILEGLLHNLTETKNETIDKVKNENKYEDENKNTLKIIFKKSYSKPLKINTLNSLNDLRNKKEDELKLMIEQYEKLLERDETINPIQESLEKEKQEIEDERIIVHKKWIELKERRDYYKTKISEEREVILEFIKQEPLFKEAAEIVFSAENWNGSASLLQRKLKLGYNRAGRIIDILEIAGIIGPFRGKESRSIIPRTQQSFNNILNKFYE